MQLGSAHYFVINQGVIPLETWVWTQRYPTLNTEMTGLMSPHFQPFPYSYPSTPHSQVWIEILLESCWDSWQGKCLSVSLKHCTPEWSGEGPLRLLIPSKQTTNNIHPEVCTIEGPFDNALWMTFTFAILISSILQRTTVFPVYNPQLFSADFTSKGGCVLYTET